MSLRRWMQRWTAMQGAGAGAAPAWTPASPTTDGEVSAHTWHSLAELYQDAAKTTPAVSGDDPVRVETNQGLDTHDVVAPADGQRPLLKLDVKNGQAALLFDGIDDYLQGAFGGGAISQPHVTFIVAALAADVVNDGANRLMYDGDDIVNRETIAQYADDTPDSWGAWSGGGAWIHSGTTDSDWHVFCFLVNGANSQLWLDGVSLGTANTGTETIDGLRIGNGQFAGQIYKGYEGQRLIYPGNISTADKNQVGQYLADYYGLTWTDINP